MFANGQHALFWEPDGSPRYLGTLGDANTTMVNFAASINELGEVVGQSQVPVLWTRTGGMRDIGALSWSLATIAGCCNT